MLRIGIIGGSEISNTADLLANIFSAKGLRTKTSDYAAESTPDDHVEFGAEISGFNGENDMDIYIKRIYAAQAGPDNFIENDFDVLIVHSLDTDKAVYIGKNKKNDSESKSDIAGNNIILLNSDEKNIFRALQNNVGSARVITYGLNSKACVTVSSISDAGVQFCVQRALPTFTGEIVEQQEFTVKADTQMNDINNILAAVTAAIVNGCDTHISF